MEKNNESTGKLTKEEIAQLLAGDITDNAESTNVLTKDEVNLLLTAINNGNPGNIKTGNLTNLEVLSQDDINHLLAAIDADDTQNGA